MKIVRCLLPSSQKFLRLPKFSCSLKVFPGERYYFSCPRCQRSVETLHFFGDWTCHLCINGRVSARGISAYERRVTKLHDLHDRLLGLDGRAPARGANRQRIANALRADKLTKEFFPDLRPLLNKEEDNQGRRDRRSAARLLRPGLSTADALAIDRAVTPPALPMEPRDSSALYIGGAAGLIRAPIPVPTDVKILEHHPSLDIRVLAKHWKRHRAGEWAHGLRWRASANIPRMIVAATLEEDDPHLLVVSEPQGEPRRLQKIQLQGMPALGRFRLWQTDSHWPRRAGAMVPDKRLAPKTGGGEADLLVGLNLRSELCCSPCCDR